MGEREPSPIATPPTARFARTSPSQPLSLGPGARSSPRAFPTTPSCNSTSRKPERDASTPSESVQCQRFSCSMRLRFQSPGSSGLFIAVKGCSSIIISTFFTNIRSRNQVKMWSYQGHESVNRRKKNNQNENLSKTGRASTGSCCKFQSSYRA